MVSVLWTPRAMEVVMKVSLIVNSDDLERSTFRPEVGMKIAMAIGLNVFFNDPLEYIINIFNDIVLRKTVI